MAAVAAVLFGMFTVAIGLISVPIDSLIHQTGPPGGPVTIWVVTAVPMVSVAAVGTLVAARRPGNPIGWMLLAIFLFAAAPTSGYAILDYRMHHGTLPLGWAAVVLGAAWPMFLVLVTILLWVFPDGRLPPGRWRGMARVLIVAWVLIGLVASARGVAAVAGHDIQVGAGGNLTADRTGLWRISIAVLIVGSIVSGLTWLIVQVPRYRRSAGERRQQFKWFYTGAIVFVIAIFLPGSNDLIGPLGAAALPVCIGVAVLKYRLFEIDRIISRVISYAIITAVLAGVFAGLVLLATEVLPFRAPVAVAAATLAAAAAFNPLRRRVQRAVDRRFNRAHYNAEAVVAAFTARLRQTVDLDTAQDDLVRTVSQAFQPAHISVWLPSATSAEPLKHG
jgi:MFS family permease